MLPFSSPGSRLPLAEIGSSHGQVIVLTIVIFASCVAYILWLIKRKL